VAASGSSRLAAAVLAALIVAVLALVARPVTVSAHALLRASEPAAGSTLGSAPASVTITFTETPDLRLTSIKVLDSGGADHVGGALEAPAAPADTVRAPLGELPDGVYTVAWRTVSQVDGHISAGTFAFGVGVPAPTGPPGAGAGGEGQEGSPPAIVARWLLYLGLVALLGAAFVAAAVVRRRSPDLLALAAGGWLLAALGTAGVVGVQWLETGAPLETLPGTSVGASALARLAAIAIVGVALAALTLGSRFRGRLGWSLVGIATAGALAVDVATGHAAAGPAWLQQITVQTLHAVAAAAWVGGLAALLVDLRTCPVGERLATARRFSTWAGVALVVVALTGVARAVAEVGSVAALLDTDFGRVVIAKSALLAGLAGIGALNRFVSLKDAARLAGALRRAGGAEVVLAVLVIGLSAWLVNLTPPTSAGGPAPVAPTIVAEGNDFGTSLRVRLIATPGQAGQNTFDVAVVDYDTDAPVEASRADLRFELASQAGVPPSTLELDLVGAGRFRGAGANLSIEGIYRVVATVEAPAGGVEVPLLVVTTIVPQRVEQLVTPGLPTIHVVSLPGIGTAQVYLDPGDAGPNELHVTYFDELGSQIPMPTATFAVRSTSSGDSVPDVRILEPGHFVASVEPGAGPLRVDAIGPLPAGGLAHVHVTIEVSP
jgi:copper transport protein